MGDKNDIPHGHGLSYKKGVADGLLDQRGYENDVHETHIASYHRGRDEGEKLRRVIGDRVKD
jgi:hypothetical protein